MIKGLRFFTLVLTMFLLCSCSESEEVSGKNIIEKQTEKIAQEGVEFIQTPIDRAKSAVDDMNKAIKRTEQATE